MENWTFILLHCSKTQTYLCLAVRLDLLAFVQTKEGILILLSHTYLTQSKYKPVSK